MASPHRKKGIPLAYDWGGKVSSPGGSPARHQFHTWKHNFAVHSPPRDPRARATGKMSLTQSLDSGVREEMKRSLTELPQAGLPPVVPRWAVDDRLVVRFYGYFQETVNDSRDEISRIRPVALLCWPLDGTMQLNELKIANSGMPAGTMVKRSVIQRPDFSFITLDELRLGADVEIYNKRIRLVDVDASTRRYFSTPEDPFAMERLGPSEPVPKDGYTKRRYVFDRPNEAPRFIDHDFKEYLASQSGVQQSKIDRGDFLTLDGQELRFKCYWDNDGIPTDLLLRYFLSTREMMVMELGTFEGKDPFPTLFKRGQLPLDWRALGSEPGGLPRGTACYGPDHFRLGTTIDLYGRQVKLMKCDEFTRRWYADGDAAAGRAGGVEVGEEQAYPPPPPPLPRNKIPPRDAFTIGSDEDTIQSCLYLVPPKPKKDYAKRLRHEGQVLRFKCRMVTRNAVDAQRQFVVKFYLEDDTIMIFEQMVANLGVVGGKFRERALVKKPDHSRYTPDDFGVGKVVTISSYKFEMLSADAFTAAWMASYESGIPFVDPRQSAQKESKK